MTHGDRKGNQSDNSVLRHGVLNKDLYSSYVVNKTQKITKALYLITNFFDVREPLKWSIRDMSIRLIQSSMSLTLSSLSDREKSLIQFVSLIQETDMLIDTAHVAGFVSSMNAEVIKRELKSIVAFVEEKHELHYSSSSRLLLTPSYFKIDEIRHRYPYSPEKELKNDESKAQQASPTLPSLSGEVTSPSLTIDAQERRKRVLDIGKSLEIFSIKDVSMHIQDCSEKTIQRLLLDMVAEGILVKEGERRWSRYKIAK